MIQTVQQLLERALQLPVSDRAALAAELIGSLDSEADDDVNAAWDAEIRRRVEELDRGEVASVPWSEARKMILGITDEAG